jgi:hypothetical protein
MSDLTIEQWIAERIENCERLMARKVGTDRQGWQEDADYFRKIAARIRELEAERDEWEITARQATSMHATSVTAVQAQCKAIEAATIERCAQVVDECNREGPYNAIGAASRIRALASQSLSSV